MTSGTPNIVTTVLGTGLSDGIPVVGAFDAPEKSPVVETDRDGMSAQIAMPKAIAPIPILTIDFAVRACTMRRFSEQRQVCQY